MTISEIKRTARTKLKGGYIKSFFATLLYFLVILVLTFIEKKIMHNIQNNILITLIEAIFAIISLLLGYGILANILNITNSKTNSITEFINISIMNTTKYLRLVIGGILIKILVPLILFLAAGFYLIGTSFANINNVHFLCFYPNMLIASAIIFAITLIILIYFLFKYVLSPFIYYEKSSTSYKEIMTTSNKLMKNKKIKLVLLMLSFIGWFILIGLIVSILAYFIEMKYITPIILVLYSLLKPYITVSQSIFYEDCVEEQEIKK